MFPQAKRNKQLKKWSFTVYPQQLYLAKYQMFFLSAPQN